MAAKRKPRRPRRISINVANKQLHSALASQQKDLIDEARKIVISNFKNVDDRAQTKYVLWAYEQLLGSLGRT